MNKLDLFKKQFLLTRENNFELPWRKNKIQNYYLYTHPELEIEYISNGNIEFYLLGFMLDFSNPQFSNRDILKELSNSLSIVDLIKNLSIYSGHFAMICNSKNQLIILNDACAQYEIYYDTTFSCFGSQPKLMSKVVQVYPHKLSEPADYYNSSFFINSWPVFIGATTHYENINHLIPNHYIDVNNKSVLRYFPKHKINPISIEEASKAAAKMLKGFITAASLRNKVMMPVTGGFDSRVLFVASLGLDCLYYVIKHNDMGNRHHDIIVPKKLTKRFKKDFHILSEMSFNDDEKQIQNESIDFARAIYKTDMALDHVTFNGNLFEIARNVYGYVKFVCPEELALFYALPINEFVSKQYKKWLTDNTDLFLEMGYNTLDMFYWEEKMGHALAKSKTEMNSLGITVYSPLSSHRLLEILLSTPRESRDLHLSKLHKAIIDKLAAEANSIPFDPTIGNTIKIILKKVGVNNAIEAARLRLQLRYNIGINQKITRYKILS